MQKVTVLIKDGKPLGMCRSELFEKKFALVKKWWNKQIEVEVPKDKYDNEEINISNIKNYF